DKEHKVGLIVDEWGCWYDVEEGTNPGFLYQQNTMRDAIVAAVNLDIFNRHSDRVIMANIAQAVNVLQAVILTEGEKLVLTPTYHVFDLYKEHQDSELVYSWCENECISDRKLNAVSQTVSVNKDGKLHITASNCSLTEEYELNCAITEGKIKNVSARVLTGEVQDCNEFDCPDRVTIKEMKALTENGRLIIKLPPCSVAAVSVEME
ncbi:MAG: alpha-L-arabinofuranosidase C-terminal domain-containing protein, partial [Ruminiclostridium sp.]